MSGFFQNLLNSLKLQDDDEAFDEYEQSEKEPERKAAGAERSGIGLGIGSKSDRIERLERPRSTTAASESRPSASENSPQTKKIHSSSNYGTSTYIDESRTNGKSLRMVRPEGQKVVPLKTMRSGLEVCIIKPKTFEESQDICDVLLSECVAIVNLEGNDYALAQRIMDFISGAVYSINGKLFPISELIYILAPGNVDISGDYDDILMSSGFDVPILGKN